MATAVDSVAPREESTVSRRPIPEAWHLLSLDAPTVAALWASFFARAMHIDLPWHEPLLLALGTWLLYVADRLLDGHRASPTAPLRLRHRFHRQHRAAFLGAGSVAAAILLWLIATRMSANARHEDTMLFLIAMLYFFLVHRPGGRNATWLPKELAVGIVFAAATAVPAWSRLGPGLSPGRLTLFPAVAVFAALCWLNCVAIERWENPIPNGQVVSPGTHASTRWTANHFQGSALVLTALSAILAIWSAIRGSETPMIYLAPLSAALCLFLADLYRSNFSRLHLRVAADLALLTPVFFLPILL